MYDYLINHSIDRDLSLKIMDDVRKGRGINESYQYLFDERFIRRCEQIQYLTQKGHIISILEQAVDYVYLHDKYTKLFFESYISIILRDSKRFKSNLKSIDKEIEDMINICFDHLHLAKSEIDFDDLESEIEKDIIALKNILLLRAENIDTEEILKSLNL